MLDMLLKQMLPPGFDLDKTIKDVQSAIITTVATVQRIETKLDAVLAAQTATVTLPMTQGNDDHRQHNNPSSNATDPASLAGHAGHPAALCDDRGRATDA